MQHLLPWQLLTCPRTPKQILHHTLHPPFLFLLSCSYLTGQVDKRTLEKYEREAKEKNRETWYLSWALDTNQEERDKV